MGANFVNKALAKAREHRTKLVHTNHGYFIVGERNLSLGDRAYISITNRTKLTGSAFPLERCGLTCKSRV